MAKRLVVLTGAYRIVGMVVREPSVQFSDIPYYQSLYDELISQASATIEGAENSLFRSLMEREFQRDREILSQFAHGHKTVFVEQWHIGNIALVKNGAPEIAREYEQRLCDLLRDWRNVSVEDWFVSTDPDKRSPAQQPAYFAYLDELSALSNVLSGSEFEVKHETLDGEALSEDILRRIQYLLKHKR